jgi:D-alanine-D-alanine ligase
MSRRVTVVSGGSTPERNVALAGAAKVVDALQEGGYVVTVVDTIFGELSKEDEATLLIPTVSRTPPSAEEVAEWQTRDLGTRLAELPAVRDTDLVFLVLHGRQGEGGEIQALFELSGTCFTGSGPLGSAIAMDKDVAKRLMRLAGVPTPDWVMCPATAEQVTELGFPLVVKPSKAGSTVGLSVVESSQELDTAIETALAIDDEVMLERFVTGREFTVGILGDRALAVGEIIPQHAIFDYECKYTPGMSQEIFPAHIPESLASDVRELALQTHNALKLRDFSRVDFMVHDDGTPLCLEANTLPGLTATSLLPQSAQAAGIGFGELCETICHLALTRATAGNKVET